MYPSIPEGFRLQGKKSRFYILSIEGGDRCFPLQWVWVDPFRRDVTEASVMKTRYIAKTERKKGKYRESKRAWS